MWWTSRWVLVSFFYVAVVVQHDTRRMAKPQWPIVACTCVSMMTPPIRTPPGRRPSKKNPDKRSVYQGFLNVPRARIERATPGFSDLTSPPGTTLIFRTIA